MIARTLSGRLLRLVRKFSWSLNSFVNEDLSSLEIFDDNILFMVFWSKLRFNIDGNFVFRVSLFRSDSSESLISIILSLLGISPSEIQSVRSERILGVNIARIELVVAKMIDISINTLYGFNSFNNLVTALPKSLTFVSELLCPPGLGIF